MTLQVRDQGDGDDTISGGKDCDRLTDGHGAADLIVVATGDHHDFTNFVL